ncbi:bacteriocin fulvocin C-related protein [Sorangium sp. So ce118]
MYRGKKAISNNIAKMAALTALVLTASACQMDDTSPAADQTSSVVALQASNLAGESCASIGAWVAAHRESLPATYEDITLFPVAYRRAIFAALPAETKSQLWQQHFQAYMEARPGLGLEQKTFIEKLSSVALPQLFAHPGDGEVDSDSLGARVNTLASEGDVLFSSDDLFRLMANLGPVEEDAPSSDSLRAQKCKCSTSSDWCGHEGPGLRCIKGRDRCDAQSFGCGALGRFRCDGLCGPS